MQSLYPLECDAISIMDNALQCNFDRIFQRKSIYASIHLKSMHNTNRQNEVCEKSLRNLWKAVAFDAFY